ncbi:YcgL domain-containing protein [Planctobacterium marinum]|uniref:YcgL domain-containing protein n=1 Tax=Planctobacterium marinum TaxID=1631968 RepID=UPI001E6407FB|nr:YcgL domain-containing protein [Planctobacterium marinum]MCC2607382.1 YcgL domain-containing protein [Planctobacterium marinum]
MLCAIYKSSKKTETYLYVEKRDDFSRVPEPLMDTFGKPQFVMLFNLAGSKSLIRTSNDKVSEALTESGYYLQLPPKTESLLVQHKAMVKGEQDD